MKNGLVKKLFDVGVFIGCVAGFSYLAYYVTHTNIISIRTDKKIESGYISPKRLDIKLEDKDKNGKKEVILDYGFSSYLFMEDKFGNPVLKEYEVKPAENIPPKIIIKE
ncbi:MAG: hypothetical protein NTZ83_02370 [Candidatus Pacearchaeota archaeon]|nr:hypothetical protein [Candidatus Pacearchaeota archaeon]